MEEFLLRTLLTGDKLNIVNQKNVRFAVFVVECIDIAGGNRRNQFVCKSLTADGDNRALRMIFLDFVGNCR